jgi:predicted enzyme related to lactoylglutathione lyase
MSSAKQQIGIESLGVVTVVVDDQDEALDFYTGTLGFEPRMDEAFEMDGQTGRWLTVGVPGQDIEIALVAPDEPYYGGETRDTLASKMGTETWWTFRTADCRASVDALESAGVEITQSPREFPWGVEAMFADPFGNEFSLFELAG